jgi:hypothetical protein
MNPLSARQLSLAAMIAGMIIVVAGAVPAVLGYYFVHFSAPELGPSAIASLKSQPGGEALANCAIASTELSAQASATMSSLLYVIKWQSAFSIVFGAVVLVSCSLL